MSENSTVREIAEVLIKKSEGLKLKEYLCPAGVKTIGWGHTRPEEITQNQAQYLLWSDIAIARDMIKDHVKVEITGHMMAALISFVFNIGADAFIKSTLLKKLNKGEYVAAGDEFLRWTYAKGKILKGLMVRRGEERILFLTPDFKEEAHK